MREGYYFVKLNNEWLIGWYFAETNNWGLVGGCDWDTEDFEEIGFKIELPE